MYLVACLLGDMLVGVHLVFIVHLAMLFGCAGSIDSVVVSFVFFFFYFIFFFFFLLLFFFFQAEDGIRDKAT